MEDAPRFDRRAYTAHVKRPQEGEHLTIVELLNRFEEGVCRLDTTGDKQVNRYVDGNHPLAAPGAGTPILAVRLWLLVRSPTDETGQGFQDNAAYAPTDRDLGQIQPGVTEGYPANFRRVAVSKTVFLRNVGGLTGA